MVPRTTLLDAATVAGAHVSEIPRKEAWRLLQAWREIYCAPMHSATGKWVIGNCAWHTFSSGYYRCLQQSRAVTEYHAQSATDLLVLPEDDRETAIRCTSGKPVDFSGLGDVYVAPGSFDWTMVFTHEHPEYGPYFARANLGS
jgi:hypothetical protein